MRINSTTPSQYVDITTPRESTLSTSTNTNITNNTISSSNGPELNAYNDYTSDLTIARKEIRNEYYAQAVALDKKFGDPAQHIEDKYKNENSKYFRSDLSENDRYNAYRNEMAYLKTGDANVSSYDPFVYDVIGTFSFTDEKALNLEFNREQINEQFAQLLEKNNITIPADTKLSFTVDPYSSKVTVIGTDDTKLINSIEAVMDEKNGSELFAHIKQTKWETNSQYTKEKINKYNAFTSIKEDTGYKLNELEIVDGKFVTEDGTDIITLFAEGIYARTDIYENKEPVIIEGMSRRLSDLIEADFDTVPDLVLTIDFENGSFHDVGQSKGFGTGETGWIFNKAESLQRDKISKQITEMIKQENIPASKDTKLTLTINSDTNKVDVSGGGEKLNSLLETLLNAENAKELFIYILLEQWDEDTPMTYDLLEDLLKNSFELMNGESISLKYEDGTLLELPENIAKIDWFNRLSLLSDKQSIDIYV